VSQELYEERLGKVETGLAGVTADMRVLGHDVSAVKGELGKVAGGVEKLLEREGRRGEPVGFKAVAATCGGLLAIALVGSWLIEHSPAVDEIKDRLNQLDNEKTGRVTRLENEAGWTARVYVEK
jgi:hypothetical protein